MKEQSLQTSLWLHIIQENTWEFICSEEKDENINDPTIGKWVCALVQLGQTERTVV